VIIEDGTQMPSISIVPAPHCREPSPHAALAASAARTTLAVRRVMAADYRFNEPLAQVSTVTPWYGVAVTVRHAVLPVGALLVLGLGVYLFVEVRAQPAPVAARARPAAPSPEPAAPSPEPAAPDSADPAVQPVASPHGSVAAQRPAAPVRPVGDPPRDAPAAPDGPLIGPKLDAAMDEANKAYDQGEYDEAKQIARRVLAQNPTNVRMLRIIVSASCIEGDSAVAQAHFARLPAHDQEQMRVRCARYGVAFADR
jgi:hypothetical protein